MTSTVKRNISSSLSGVWSQSHYAIHTSISIKYPHFYTLCNATSLHVWNNC